MEYIIFNQDVKFSMRMEEFIGLFQKKRVK